MNSRFFRHTVCPLLAALIWGSSFSAQKVASGYFEPIGFNAGRSLLAILVLGTVLFVRGRIRKQKGTVPEKQPSLRTRLRAFAVCGGSLAAATILQQAGIRFSTAGKTSFITALYVVLVPIGAMLVFRQKIVRTIWAAVALAVAGLYLIAFSSGDAGLRLEAGDLMILGCAFLFTVQILAISRFSREIDPVELVFLMFFGAALIEIPLALILEGLPGALPAGAWLSLLYVGLFSSAIAYLLQAIAQMGGDPAVVTLLLSMESVFAAVFGALLLQEKMTGRELAGCGLMLAAVLLAELPEAFHASRRKERHDT